MSRADDFGKLGSILAGYVPSGIAYGALAAAVHIPAAFIVLLSLLVYSGAVQSAFVGYWSIGFEPISMILTAILLNLRHTFYGPHLEQRHRGVKREYAITVGAFLTDEVYAIGISEPPMPLKKLRLVSLFSYACWFSGTVIGIATTGGLPEYVLPILSLALPALFLGLMIPRVKNAGTVAAALGSIASAVLVHIFSLPDYFILLAILAGVLAGLPFSNLRTGDAA